MKSAPLLILVLFTTTSSAFAESVPYRMPPKAIADIADAAPTPQVILDPSGEWLLVLEHEALASIADLSREELRLAGIRLNPQTNARSRRDVAIRAELLRVADGSSRPIKGLPESPRIDHASFSPDGASFAFTHTTGDALELWVANVATGTAKRVAPRLNGVFDDIYQWRSDGKSLIARTVPQNRGPAPEAPSGPRGTRRTGDERRDRRRVDLPGSTREPS